MKKALIIGGSGMDGRLMTEFLLDKGYEVTATYRNNKIENPNVKSIQLEFTPSYIFSLMNIDLSIFDEVYNFSGVSYTPDSIRLPDYCHYVNYDVVVRLLGFIFMYRQIKFFQSSSAEVFGYKNQVCTINTPRYPVTPYAEAKNKSDMFCRFLREEGLKIYNGISFNHEHQYRDNKFLVKKVCHYVARLTLKINEPKLELGNLDAERDWGYAPDFIEGYWMMMQGEPCELIFGTGEKHSVRDVLETAFGMYGYNYFEHIYVSDKLFRDDCIGNADISETTNKIGWKPKTSFTKMIELIIDSEIKRLMKEYTK
jgi:GDPmannose 4,6-dehydratase